MFAEPGLSHAARLGDHMSLTFYFATHRTVMEDRQEAPLYAPVVP
jgi:hypothetical protein